MTWRRDCRRFSRPGADGGIGSPDAWMTMVSADLAPDLIQVLRDHFNKAEKSIQQVWKPRARAAPAWQNSGPS